ncbi:MAG: hemerythrin HHE cation binding domain protein [Linnemannia gamsii]|nr:MAG: hemerythrin HHE cation binding domain protein [Linnemannia gamsii]
MCDHGPNQVSICPSMRGVKRKYALLFPHRMLSSRLRHIAATRRTLLPHTTATVAASASISSANHYYRHHRHLSTSSIMTQATTQQRISEPVKKDHRELEEYYHKILDAKDEEEKTRWANQFTWELARHSVGEELVMYPQMKKSIEDGDALVEKDLREHQEASLLFVFLFCLFCAAGCCELDLLTRWQDDHVKEQLFRFQSMKATDPEFEPLLEAIYKNLAQHIKEEEEIDLIKLEQELSNEESFGLANKFHLTKKFVPTRSHPSAPNQPPFETVVGLLTAPIDKLRDAFSRFPKDE